MRCWRKSVTASTPRHWNNLFRETQTMNLTPRQLDVIVAIRNYRHLHGYSPTMQELADQLGTSKVTIFEHVGALEKKRVLRRDKHKARSLEIIVEGRLPDEERATKLPLLGNIAAGSPIEAVENREELDLESLFHSKNGVYVLKVRGESMIDDHLCDRKSTRLNSSHDQISYAVFCLKKKKT